MNSAAYRQVLRAYELDRARARELHARRKAEVYARIPRVKELDGELTRLGLGTARGILSGGEDRPEAVKERMRGLIGEKQSLMEAAGFPGQYLADVHVCPHCRDTGYIGRDKCACLKRRLIGHHYGMSGLGASASGENFQTFEFKYYSDETDPSAGISPLSNIRNIYAECVNFVTGFGAEFINLLFYGKPGLGKTFLCNCVACDLLDAGVGVLYVTAPELFKKIEKLRFNRGDGDEPGQLELIYEADALIIDDLGSEFSTVVTDAELFNIVNSRLLARKPTVISTNLTLRDFQSAYTERIVSRITGNYVMLRLFGDDIRMRKKIMAVSGG